VLVTTVKSCHRTQAEHIAHTRKCLSVIKMQAGSMLVRQILGDAIFWVITPACVDEFLTRVACLFLYETGVRGGSITVKGDHVITSDCMCFGFRDPVTGQVIDVWGAQALRAAALKWGLTAIVHLVVYSLSGKMRKKTLGCAIGVRNDDECECILLIARAMLAGNAADSDGVFSRAPNPELGTGGTGKTLNFQIDRVRAAVKAACIPLGLDPDFYSAHSLRKGMASECYFNLLPETAIDHRGGWAERSKVMMQTYVCPLVSGVGPSGSRRAPASKEDDAEQLAFAKSVIVSRKAAVGVV
jgi:hypothetical protein